MNGIQSTGNIKENHETFSQGSRSPGPCWQFRRPKHTCKGWPPHQAARKWKVWDTGLSETRRYFDYHIITFSG